MIRIPNCIDTCIHYIKIESGKDNSEVGENVICKAFPNGIPPEIDWPSTHMKLIEGQENDIVYRAMSPRDKVVRFLDAHKEFLSKE